MLSSALKNLSKHSIIYISAIAFNRGASFLIIPLVTAYIGSVENYGVKEIAEVAIALMVQLLGFTVFQAMVRYLADADTDLARGQILNTSLYLVAGGAGALLLLCLIFADSGAVALFGSEEYAPALRVTAAILFFSVFTRWGLAYFGAQEQSVLYSAIITSKLVLEILLKVVFLVYMNLTYMGVLYSVLWSEIIFGVGIFCVLQYRHRIGFSPEIARRLLSYVFPLILSGLFMFVVHQGDRFFIRIFDGLDSTGIYGLGYKFGSIVNALIYTGFATIWFPFIFKVKEDGQLRELCRTVLIGFGAVTCFATLVLCVFGAELVSLMVPREFQEAARVLPLIAISYIFWIIFQLFHTIFFIRERTKLVLVISLSAAIINTLLNVVLVPEYGYIGAAWSTLGAYFSAAAIAYILAQRVFYIPYDLGRLSLAVGLAALFWILSSAIEVENTMMLIALKILLCLAYPLVLLTVGYLTPEAKSGLYQLLRNIGK
ncbi:MAG: oligosaccharide flippase family protein [Alphaproteobacteria bacterium]|nr:oligosaccharide flippase family protein [Alphaproteobacteria bacterium]